MKNTLVSIIIPVYNEAKTTAKLLDFVYAHQIPGARKELVVVESNSTDGSREIVQSFAKGKTNVVVILEDRPEGKGTAVRKGFKQAKGDIILIQDADLEYDVKDYDKLVKPIVEGRTDFVLGSRHLNDSNKREWLIRRFKGIDRIYAHIMNFGGILFHTFYNLVYGTKLTDPTTMYKVFKKDLLKKVNLQGKYFELDWEIVCKFVRLGHLPLEIPIKYQSRGLKEGKKVKFSRDVLRWVYTIVKYRFLPLEKL